MMKTMIQSLLMLLVFTILTGILYPLFITGIAQTAFPKQANGSLVTINGKLAGSLLIGQAFTSSRYFHGRPSANDYDAMNSGGFNLGPASSNLIQTVSNRILAVRAENNLPPDVKIPADMVLASASGLDPDISPENARIQAIRIAKVRSIPTATVLGLIEKNKEIPAGGFWGIEKINVLKLNRELDKISEGK